MRGHDYSGGGAYFVTTCVQTREPLFGRIAESEMILNEAGQLVERAWHNLPQRFRLLVADAFQVMPNHLHGILVIPGPGLEPALAAVATSARVIEPEGRGLPPPLWPRRCSGYRTDQADPACGIGPTDVWVVPRVLQRAAS